MESLEVLGGERLLTRTTTTIPEVTAAGSRVTAPTTSSSSSSASRRFASPRTEDPRVWSTASAKENHGVWFRQTARNDELASAVRKVAVLLLAQVSQAGGGLELAEFEVDGCEGPARRWY